MEITEGLTVSLTQTTHDGDLVAVRTHGASVWTQVTSRRTIVRYGAVMPSMSAYAQMGFDVPLETKLHAPAARDQWVKREELVGYLAGATAELILVDAPAGFGKTTLVAQWRASSRESRPFGWVSLDPGDNDPGRLWLHVVSALQQACPGFGAGEVLGALRSQAPDFAGRLLPLLVNELAGLGEPVVLVLDDYQVIRHRDCHDQVTFLLLHLPPAVQVVLITRTDPPLPLARLRAAGELAEVRARDLRFTPEQAAQLVAANAGIALSGPELADLVDRTEGWPAGICQFLARTSILSRFCAPLCAAVTGSDDAAAIIGALERDNLFVVPLDDTGQWFRYHHLFAQVLRGELARAEPDMLPVLHKRAGDWHRRAGLPDEAIQHLQAV